MAVAQLVGADFLFVHWKEYALSGLGEGATGRIYQSPLSSKMGFAFKTFRKSSDPSLEAETYKALVAEMLVLCHPGVREHQNIVGFYGVSFDVITFDLGGATHRRLWPVLVLEKSSHGDLATFFKDHSMSLQDAMLVAERIGAAVQEMHLADIIHGDIKPENVLIHVESSSSALVPKVTDFGFSCYGCDEESTVYPPRTPGWCAPEWHPRGFSFKDAKKMDVYSYGLLCAWICLQGKVDPSEIASKSVDELLKQIADIHSDVIIRKPALNEILGRLRGIFDRSLARDARERDGHIQNVLEEFRNPFLSSAE
ncbi:kinase-like protein [Mytilinidion resinicola]|uniref:Kinase-like protein n=1 Tax=Mytilinidion resinicola TaxID=574789 RepID=A0A6A6YZL2_9PEZI|nr:kinase-like protein [Mytilinidion resinicola]KAF2814366.1 kinase-like protein [Mytilinidion resinicola]